MRCRYTGLTFLADRLFEVFALMWLVMRLMMYPYVVWSAHIERPQHTDDGRWERFGTFLCEPQILQRARGFGQGTCTRTALL